MSYDKVRARRGQKGQAEAAGEVADSMEVRRALMDRVHKGEITLKCAQEQLKSIQRLAKKNGKVTRNQAYLGRRA